MLIILFYHVSFFFFLVIDSYVSIAAVITQILNPIAELVILTGVPTKEAKSEMEIHLGTVKLKYSWLSNRKRGWN